MRYVGDQIVHDHGDLSLTNGSLQDPFKRVNAWRLVILDSVAWKILLATIFHSQVFADPVDGGPGTHDVDLWVTLLECGNVRPMVPMRDDHDGRLAERLELAHLWL